MSTIAHFLSRQRVAITWSLVIGVVLLLIPTSLVLSQGGGRVADAAPAVGSAASMTWQSVLDRSNLHWNNIEFAGRNVAYAAGGDTWDGPYTVPATYAKSTDGGVNWTTKSLPTGAWMRGLECKDANTCWTVGQGGKIHKTTDGGNTWVQLTIPGYSTWMYAVALTGVGDGLAVGLTGEIARRRMAQRSRCWTHQDTASRMISVVRPRGCVTRPPSSVGSISQPITAPPGA